MQKTLPACIRSIVSATYTQCRAVIEDRRTSTKTYGEWRGIAYALMLEDAADSRNATANGKRHFVEYR